jgi:hypothetical protein
VPQRTFRQGEPRVKSRNHRNLESTAHRSRIADIDGKRPGILALSVSRSRLIATFGGIAAVVTVLGFFGSLWWIFDLFEFGIGYGAKIGRQDDHRQIGEIWSKP